MTEFVVVDYGLLGDAAQRARVKDYVTEVMVSNPELCLCVVSTEVAGARMHDSLVRWGFPSDMVFSGSTMQVKDFVKVFSSVQSEGKHKLSLVLSEKLDLWRASGAQRIYNPALL